MLKGSGDRPRPRWRPARSCSPPRVQRHRVPPLTPAPPTAASRRRRRPRRPPRRRRRRFGGPQGHHGLDGHRPGQVRGGRQGVHREDQDQRPGRRNVRLPHRAPDARRRGRRPDGGHRPPPGRVRGVREAGAHQVARRPGRDRLRRRLPARLGGPRVRGRHAVRDHREGQLQEHDLGPAGGPRGRRRCAGDHGRLQGAPDGRRRRRGKPLVVSGKDTWTLGDWFENIYLRTAGPDKYAALFGGTLPFTDQTVVDALAR